MRHSHLLPVDPPAPRRHRGQADEQARAIRHPRAGLPRVVSGRRARRRHGGNEPRARLHGDQAVGLGRLGAHSGRARLPHQGNRPRQLLLPAVHSDELHRQGGRARRGLRQGDGGRHASPPEERQRQACRRSRRQARGAADRAADVGNDHRRCVPALDQELSRPAAADQPVGQRRALGDAHAPVPAHDGIPLAGGAHRARRPRRCHGRDAEDARGLSRVRRERAGDARRSPARSPPTSVSPAPTIPIRSKR